MTPSYTFVRIKKIGQKSPQIAFAHMENHCKSCLRASSIWKRSTFTWSTLGEWALKVIQAAFAYGNNLGLGRRSENCLIGSFILHIRLRLSGWIPILAHLQHVASQTQLPGRYRLPLCQRK